MAGSGLRDPWRHVSNPSRSVHHPSVRSLAVIPILLVIGVISPQSAHGRILPMVVDNTGDEAAFWWANESSEPAGAFDEHLFAAAGPRWISPREQAPSGAVSSIFRRGDITLNNALSLASLFDAEHILIGDIALEGSAEQPWLGLTRTEFVLRGYVVDVGSGAVLDELVVRRIAYGASNLAVAAVAVAEQGRRAAEALVRTPGEVGVPEDGDVVVIRSHLGAAPFIAVRGALRDVHPGVVDVAEAWATEGAVALALELDEGVEFAEVASSVARLAGTTIDGIDVIEVAQTELGLEVVATPGVPAVEAP